MSGILYLGSGNLNNRGTEGRFWSSTPVSYASSWYLYFNSTNVGPKNGDYKPNGFTLRRVARFPSKSPPLFHLNKLSEVRSALKIPLSCTFSSRALRSLPLSVMMTGDLRWGSSSLVNRGTNGGFWVSTLNSYTLSRRLGFYSTNVSPKSGGDKPGGFTLRCVARFTCTFSSRALRSLPLSVMMSGNHHWRIGNLYYRGTDGYFWTSTLNSYVESQNLYFSSSAVHTKDVHAKPFGFPLRCVALLKKALRSFQSSPQPPSFGYDVGRSRLELRQSLRKRRRKLSLAPYIQLPH